MNSGQNTTKTAGAPLTHYEEALLKKRKKDDYDKNKRIDMRAKHKMEMARSKKLDERKAAGAGTVMPEVFVSNHMKQQRNFVHYKRQKNRINRADKLEKQFNASSQLLSEATQSQDKQVREDVLILAIRIKGLNEATTPQCQKILSELGLRNNNNAVFLKTNRDTIKKIISVQEYICYGYPTFKTVNQLIRKRGFLRKDLKKEAITNNVLIEDMLGPKAEGQIDEHMGCICIEDVIDTVFKCWKTENDKMFEQIRKKIWPFQITQKKETMEKKMVAHESTGVLMRKKNTKTKKGGYQGFMDIQINEYIQPLI